MNHQIFSCIISVHDFKRKLSRRIDRDKAEIILIIIQELFVHISD
jgi:hypothetical protein